MVRLFPLLIVFSCAQDRGFGGQDLGGDKLNSTADTELNGSTGNGDDDDADTPTSGDESLLGMDQAYCEDTGITVNFGFFATGGAGQIGIVHGGTVAQCCAEWMYNSVIDDVAKTIDITYSDVSQSTCDCECPWVFEYTLTDVTAGDWSLNAAGDEADVRVD